MSELDWMTDISRSPFMTDGEYFILFDKGLDKEEMALFVEILNEAGWFFNQHNTYRNVMNLTNSRTGESYIRLFISRRGEKRVKYGHQKWIVDAFYKLERGQGDTENLQDYGLGPFRRYKRIKLSEIYGK